MFKSDTTPVRYRTVMSEAYTAAGNPDFQFIIPQPFTAEYVEGVVSLGADPNGVANQLNQVLAENLSNNMAARIRNCIKTGIPLPSQEDMDMLYNAYDFSGLRQSSGIVGTMFDRIFNRLAGVFIKKLIKRKGHKDMPPPVTVAKRDELPGKNQISYEDFEYEVDRLVAGEGPWGELEPFINVREGIMEDARVEESTIRARELDAENKLKIIS